MTMDARFDWAPFEDKLRVIVDDGLNAAHIAGLKEALEICEDFRKSWEGFAWDAMTPAVSRHKVAAGERLIEAISVRISELESK